MLEVKDYQTTLYPHFSMINMYHKFAIETYVLLSDKLDYLSANDLLMELHTN